MTIHYLKTHTEFFELSIKGNKPIEVRKDDRKEKYKKGDVLTLMDYSVSGKKNSNRQVSWKVTYVLEGGQFGIEKGYVVMALTTING